MADGRHHVALQRVDASEARDVLSNDNDACAARVFALQWGGADEEILLSRGRDPAHRVGQALRQERLTVVQYCIPRERDRFWDLHPGSAQQIDIARYETEGRLCGIVREQHL